MDCKNMMKSIREKTGLSRKDFCKKYGLPYQTVTDWELGHRTAPDYVMRMLAFSVLMNEKKDQLIYEGAKLDEQDFSVLDFKSGDDE